MRIVLENGDVLDRSFTAAASTGFVAKSIIIDADDIRDMLWMAENNRETFRVAMRQLEHRFIERRRKAGV